MLKLFTPVILLIVSGLTYANAFTHSNGHKVLSVNAGYSSKEVYFEISGDGPDICNGSGKVIAVDPERSDINQVLSILLYAHASGKTVDLQIYNTICLGSSKHRIMRRVKVNNS